MPAKFVVEISRAAEADAVEISDYIAQDRPDAADRFLQELEKLAANLERWPARCPLIAENELMGTAYRHLVYGNYRTIFRMSGRQVVVLRIIHGARLVDSSLFDAHP